MEYRNNAAEANIDNVVNILDMRRRQRVIGVASGHFDPAHLGHFDYLKNARDLVDILVVVVNNDFQVRLKKGKPFMNEWDRLYLMGEWRCVDHAVLSVDSDRSVNKTIELLRPHKFLNGGDVSSEGDCREAETCRRLGIEMVFGVGGYEKIRSSSELIAAARTP